MPAPTYPPPTITPKVAAQVLYHFDGPRPPALRPGSFITSLIDTIAHADPNNQRRLALGFPDYVVAVQLAQDTADGVATLRRLAGGGQTTIEALKEPLSITCPNCGRASYHPEDVRQGFCGHCKQWTSPPFGAVGQDGPPEQQLDTRYCGRCGRDVPTVMWVGDDHAVIVTGELVFEDGAAQVGGVEFPIHAPAEMVPCSKVDWTETRG